MLKRTEKHLERMEQKGRGKPATTNEFTGVISEYEYVTPAGFRLVPGTKFRVSGLPGQIFDFKSVSTNKRGERWIDAYGGSSIRPEHRHYRGYRAFPLPDTKLVEPKKGDR